MKRPALTLLAATLLASQAFAVTVTTIDPFTTGQLVFTNNGSISNTQPGTSIGGYRTLVLNSLDPSAVPTFLGVDDTTQQLILDSPPGVTPTFQVIWGGVDGTSGLGGVAFGDGSNPLDLLASVLSFSLVATDQPNNFTWNFTDTNNNTATYTGSFPAHLATNPSLPYSIPLNSFANATNINWNAIDFIVFAGGGATSVDMTLDAPIQVSATSVPEPGTWALIATGLAATTLVLRRQSRRGR